MTNYSGVRAESSLNTSPSKPQTLYATCGNFRVLHQISMTNRIFFLLLLTVFAISCSDRPSKPKETFNFTTYELSFFDGWSRRFSISIDTSKVYLATYKADTLKYGILPDSVFDIINKNALLLFNDSTIRNKNRECFDCSEISILATLKGDSVRLLQKGDVSERFFFIVEVINNYLETSRSSWKLYPFPYSQLLFETSKSILPPLPPPVQPLPKKTKKS